MSSTELDLSTSEDVKRYLSGGSFASDLVEQLSGGSANYTFRLHLTAPYEGHKTLVLKHGKPFVAFNHGIAFDLKRQTFEVAAMRWVRSWLPASSLVSTARVHRFDERAHCVIMDDAGATTSTLKQFILDGRCSLGMAAQIGDALGAFLAQLHQHGREDAQFREMVHANAQAKFLSGWATHGRVVSTLDGSDSDNLVALRDPPLDVKKGDLVRLGSLAERVQADIMSASEEFVMGDFWPGNILVNVNQDGTHLNSLTVVDWELVKTGVSAHDVGQFAAEMHLIRHFYPPLAGTALALLDALSVEYAKVSGRGSLAADPKFVHDMLAHQGAHVVTWTPRVQWGDYEATRGMVMEGYQQLVDLCK